MDTLPASPVPEKTRISGQVQNIANITQSLRGVVSHRGGHRWQFALEYPPLERDEVTELWTFLDSQLGRFGAFYFNLPNHPTRGTMAGNPVVAGADQRGDEVLTAGWPSNSGGILRVGDYIRFEGDYKTYRVKEDVRSDADGNAIVPIVPALQKSPIDGNGVVSDNRFRCSLTADTVEVDVSQAMTYGLKIQLIEVLR